MTFRNNSLQAAAMIAGLFSITAHAATVARDADGALRAPTAAEAAALSAAKASSQPVGIVSGRVNPQPVVHADGSVEHELTTDTLSYSVARRNADGSIEMVCVTGSEAAEKAVKAPASFAKRIGSKAKEASNVK